MNRYAIYESTGQIVSVVRCPEAEVSHYAAHGRRAMPCPEGVDDSTHYISGNTFVPFPPRPAPHHTWVWEQLAWADRRSLEQAKVTKWRQIKAARNAAENGGFNTALGRFDSNSASQTKLIGAAQLASIALAQGSPFSIQWTLQNNTSVSLDANQMISVGVALAAHIDAVHQRGGSLRARIGAAATLQELEIISWDVT